MHSELFKIVLTASFALIGGVILLVVSQILTRFVIDPLLDFRRLLGEVGHTLVFYSQYLFNPEQMASTPEFQKATRECRTLGEQCADSPRQAPLSLIGRPRFFFRFVITRDTAAGRTRVAPARVAMTSALLSIQDRRQEDPARR
jgi:hypothetical protein